ncbi:hypothetical protein ABIC22_005030 [Paenibacillus sp. PvP094]
MLKETLDYSSNVVTPITGGVNIPVPISSAGMPTRIHYDSLRPVISLQFIGYNLAL